MTAPCTCRNNHLHLVNVSLCREQVLSNGSCESKVITITLCCTPPIFRLPRQNIFVLYTFNLVQVYRFYCACCSISAIKLLALCFKVEVVTKERVLFECRHRRATHKIETPHQRPRVQVVRLPALEGCGNTHNYVLMVILCYIYQQKVLGADEVAACRLSSMMKVIF